MDTLTPANANTSRTSSTPTTYTAPITTCTSDKHAPSPTPVTPDQYPCGTCNVNIGDEDALECEICSVWTHGGQRCSGLPHDVFRNVVDYSDLGVSYVCTSCRLNKNSKDNNTSGYKQLFESVKGLNRAVADLALEVKNIKSLSFSSTQSQPSLPVDNFSPQADSPHFRKILQEELIEIRQREKRADFIIIRGLGSDINEVQAKFTVVANFLFKSDKTITLQDITPIKSDLVRARVLDQQDRRELLSISKNLKGSTHDGVFISRDLTYKQRMAIKQRASSQAQTRLGGPEDPPARPRVAPSNDSSASSLLQAQTAIPATPVTLANLPSTRPKN